MYSSLADKHLVHTNIQGLVEKNLEFYKLISEAEKQLKSFKKQFSENDIVIEKLLSKIKYQPNIEVNELPNIINELIVNNKVAYKVFKIASLSEEEENLNIYIYNLHENIKDGTLDFYRTCKENGKDVVLYYTSISDDKFITTLFHELSHHALHTSINYFHCRPYRDHAKITKISSDYYF